MENKSGSKSKKIFKLQTPISAKTDHRNKMKKRRQESFSRYIHIILKSVHPDMAISRKSMSIMNSFIMDLFERLAREASAIVTYTKKHTLDSRSMQTASNLVLPGELAKHAVSEGMKAISMYMKSKVH